MQNPGTAAVWPRTMLRRGTQRRSNVTIETNANGNASDNRFGATVFRPGPQTP